MVEIRSKPVDWKARAKVQPLKDQLEENCSWLFSELGFRIVSYSYDPAHFDDSMVTLESDAFRLQFIRDMGIVHANVAPPSDPERWLYLPFVCQAIFGERPDPSLEGYGPLIRERFAELAGAMGPNCRRRWQCSNANLRKGRSGSPTIRAAGRQNFRCLPRFVKRRSAGSSQTPWSCGYRSCCFCGSSGASGSHSDSLVPPSFSTLLHLPRFQAIRKPWPASIARATVGAAGGIGRCRGGTWSLHF